MKFSSVGMGERPEAEGDFSRLGGVGTVNEILAEMVVVHGDRVRWQLIV